MSKGGRHAGPPLAQKTMEAFLDKAPGTQQMLYKNLLEEWRICEWVKKEMDKDAFEPGLKRMI